MFDTCVILAGGRGSRISNHTRHTPKPLIRINNQPFIYYLIEHLHSYAISNFLILTGYLGQQFDEVTDYYRSKSYIRVQSFQTEQTLNTASRLYEAKHLLNGDVLICYGDVYAEIDLTRYYQFYKLSEVCSTNVQSLSRHINLSEEILYDNKENFIPVYKDTGYMATTADFIKQNLNTRLDEKFENWLL